MAVLPNSSMRRRIFLKLLAAMVLVVLIAAGMLDLSQQNLLKNSLEGQLAQSLQSKAQTLAQRVAAGTPSEFSSLAQEAARASLERVTILSRDGKVIADAGVPANALEIGQSIPLNASDLRAILVKHRPVGRHSGKNLLYVSVPAGAYIVRVGYPLRDSRETLRVVRSTLLWATLLALLIALFVAAILANLASRRLARILDFAHRMAAGDFSARIQDTGGDEIAAVAQALDGTANRVEAVFRDLDNSRQELVTVLDSMQEAVIAVDGQNRIHWTNRVMRDLIGGNIRPGSPLVETIRDPALLACVEAAAREWKNQRGRASTVVPGRVFEVSAAPMPGGSAVAVLHDITEIERVEKTRRDFIANVSHELRTPLTSISGYTETLLEDGAPLEPQARDFLAIIGRNAARMTRLTDDLLALARIESGEYKLNRKPIQARLLVEEASAVLAGLLMDRKVTLEIAESTPLSVLADPDAILQVLSNFLENAVKYGGGPRIAMGSRPVKDAVEFYVRDFGTGISSEHIGRIFERFYRVDKDRSRESGGTGLGLAIAKHIILAHAGTIRAESDLNQGSTFYFTLPLAYRTEDPAGVSSGEVRSV